MAFGFQALSSRGQVVVFAILFVTIPMGAWRTFIQPERAGLEARAARLTAIQSDVQRAEGTQARLALLQQEVRSLEHGTHEPSRVLSRLQEIAARSGLELATWRSKPVQVSFEGTYHNLGQFFARVAASGGMSVSDLHIKPASKPGGPGTISAICIASHVVLSDDVMMPPADDVGAGRDPFVSLIAPKRPTQTVTSSQKRVRLSEFAVAEISVTGIVRKGELTLAILEGPLDSARGGSPKPSFVARPGDRLLDAVVKQIDERQVIFASHDALQPIRKTIHRAEPIR